MTRIVNGDALEEARLRAGFFVHEACELVGRSPATWRRWRREGAPAWALKVILLASGDLSPLGWEGWRIASGELIRDRDGSRWTPGDLDAVRHIEEVNQWLRRGVNQRRASARGSMRQEDADRLRRVPAVIVRSE